jgi:hypothetical protein
VTLVLHLSRLAGAPGEGKSSLLSLVMLRHMPYKGVIAFQLPFDALGACTDAAAWQPPAQDEARSSTASDAAAASDGLTRGPVATLGYGTAQGGDGWVWAQFSFLKDDQVAARRAMAMVSLSSAVLFRWGVQAGV